MRTKRRLDGLVEVEVEGDVAELAVPLGRDLI
jgi:hypothetical protein